MENTFTKPKVKERRNGFTPLTVVMLVVLALYTLSLFIVLAWAFITAFKNDQLDFRTNILGLPKKWEWNIGEIFRQFHVLVNTDAGQKQVGMMGMYLNSVLYAVGCAFFHTLMPCITAYLCARFKYKFSKVLHTVVIVCMVIPIVGSLPSEISMAKTFGLYDTIWGMWIMKCNFLGIYFLVFHGTFKTLPMAFSEAAKVDGAGNLRILFRIIMPLVRNLFLTVMLINFISYWNDYQTPLVYIPSHPTVSQGMYDMAIRTGNAFSSVPMRMASAILTLVPILVLFLCFHKRLLGNLTVGGVKG